MSNLQFTTLDAIARRLQGRLDLTNDAGVAVAWKKNEVSKSSNPETVTQIANQKEAFLRTVLRCVYKFPLQLTDPDTRAVLAEITEKLVVSELIDLYYQGSGAGIVGTEGSGLSAGDRKSAYEMLNLYTAGHGFPLPQVPYMPSGIGQKDPQGVVLPGESLNPKSQDFISRIDTYIGTLPRDSMGMDDRPPGAMNYNHFRNDLYS